MRGRRPASAARSGRRCRGMRADQLRADGVGRFGAGSRRVAPVLLARSSCASAQQLRRLGMLRGGVAEQDRLALAGQQRWRRSPCASPRGSMPCERRRRRPCVACDRGGDVGQRLRASCRRRDDRLAGDAASASRRRRRAATRPARRSCAAWRSALREQRMVLAQERADDQRALAASTASDRHAEPRRAAAARRAKSEWRRR